MSTQTPPVIGIAGGIGSGKSAVASAFADLGCVVSDSDAEARAVLQTDAVRGTLVSWWGVDVLDAEGRIDRAEVAKRVFTDPGERARLEALMHPEIHRRRESLFDEARGRGVRALVIDAPLLFEAGLDSACDAVVFVDTPRDVRESRVRARGWDTDELDRRERAQLSLDEKRRRSDYVIANDGDLAALRRAVQRVLSQILAD